MYKSRICFKFNSFSVVCITLNRKYCDKWFFLRSVYQKHTLYDYGQKNNTYHAQHHA
ncbi:hypothetical protein SAMN05421766_106132 [Zobellia uliginosa]|uniref:Uncharacterized protein n=1 Tax=Zobellia uliginosa TaxID=143224 RepID=A0ABY1L022_9FLAO|nr:hypothetical protein SAMN05421766_106132 [Zobellia uliginosa]